MIALVSFFVAFASGVASFMAPCTLALVPLYISYMAGYSLANSDRCSGVRTTMVANTVLFSLGFTAVFVTLGAASGALFATVTAFGPWLSRISGIFIIAMGLMTLGLLNVPSLPPGLSLRQKVEVNFGWLGSFLIGATFALNWTPCVGPILGTILAVAGTGESVKYGAQLLAAYSLGLMLPFIAAGLGAGWTSKLLRTQGRWLEYAHHAAGVFFILLGVALFSGVLPRFSSYLAFGA